MESTMVQTRLIQKKLIAFLAVAPIALIYMVLAMVHPKVFLAFDMMAYVVMVGLMAFMTYVIVKTDGEEIKPRPTYKAKVKVADPRSQVVSAAILGAALMVISYVGVKSPELLFSVEVVGFLVMAMMITAIAGFLWRSMVPPVPKEIRVRATSLTKRVNDPKGHVKQVMAKAAADAQAAQAAEVAAAAAAAALPPPDVVNPEDVIEIEEGESLEDIKARLKPKKPKISMELLNTANSYDDKVALLRFLVSEDSARVSKAIQNFIR
jgi:hypothetical protein